jgi:DoxX-like family
MFIAYAVIAVVFALILAISARGKLVQDERIVTTITGVGYPLRGFPLLAACEIAGALGLLVGLWIPALGIAAAIGLVAYFIAAVGAHVRAGDVKNAGPAFFLLLLAAAALVFRILSA